MDQLSRGLEQVPVLVFGSGPRTATTLVVATLMEKERTTVYVLDPPNNDEHLDASEEGIGFERISINKWRIDEPEMFERRVWNFRLAQILNWAGQYKSSIRRIPKEDVDLDLLIG